MTYRVGIIGCGRMACTIDDEVVGKLDKSGMLLPYCHAGGYLDYPETEMVAACDIDQERLRNALGALAHSAWVQRLPRV